MSDLRVTRLRGRTLGSSPSLPDGVVVTGIGTFNDTTQSISPTTGAVIISGGVGIAKSLHVGGNVSVAGTLTYEDVTNVDSIGIITARNSVKITGGDLTIGVGATIYNPTSNTLVVDTNGSQRVLIGASGEISIAGATGNSGQVLTSQGGSAPPSWTTISAAPEFAGIASGSITGGKAVCVADDGKLMAVAGDNELHGTTTQFGDVTNSFSIIYDPVNEKYVYFFRDQNNGDKGRVRVGTPNGSTITWGDKQLFVAETTEPSQINAIYDPTNNKCVVLYRDNANNNKGSVVVCSLSGTTLTVGTPVTDITEQSGGMEYNSFCYVPDTDNYAIVYNNSSGNNGYCKIGKYTGTNSSTWPNASVQFLSGQARGTGCFYDTTANKLVVMAHHGGDSNTSYIWAGTVASDTVTFGSSQKYGMDNVDMYRLTGAHDPNTGTSILSYGQSGNKGVCRTATLSGTTFTFGDEFQYDISATYQALIAYGSSPNKFLISYVDEGDANKVKSIITTLSGTTITYATARTFQIYGQATSADAWLLYNEDAKNFLALYRSNQDGTNKAAYYIEAIRSSNVTKGNYVGIANATVTDGQTASTALPGAVNTAVSGLTVGQKYYVIADGTLNTTADSENIDAGNAIDVNKLLVR